MHIVQKKLVESYTTLVMGNRMTLEEVPETKAINSNVYPIRSEVEIEIANRTIAALG